MTRNPLINLVTSNRGRGLFKVEASGDTEATIFLYDFITSDDYWGGITPLAVAKELATIKAGTLHVRVHSPGGDAIAGRAIEQHLREFSGKVITHIDGWALSAASYIALAGDEIVIAPGGMFMIHEAATGGWGTKRDMAATASLLNKIDEQLLDTYHQKTGIDRVQLAEWLEAETWFTANEAVEHGFADKIADGSGQRAEASNCVWDVSSFRNVPKNLHTRANPAPAPENDPAPAPRLEAWLTDHLRRRLEVSSRI